MDILKTAIDWAKSEIFSSSFFILFGILFVAGTLGFWQLGKTDLAKAFVYPSLVAGILLMVIGIGLVYSNSTRIKRFPEDHKNDPQAFVQSEIARANKDIAAYQNVVYRAVPLIVVIAALLLVFLDKSLWRAICITTIAMMTVILVIDNNAQARMKEYKATLVGQETAE